MAPSPAEIEQLNNSLQKALEFSSKDLDSNRRGQLSEKQRLMLEHQLMGGFFVLPVFVIYWGLCWNPIINFINTRTKNLDLSKFVYVCIFAGTVVLLVAMIVQTFIVWRQRKVRSVEAYIALEISKPWLSKSRSYFMIYAGERCFNVNMKVFEAFHDGENYIIYYLPFTNKIVAAEWIPPQEAYTISLSNTAPK